jgi:hypothetical protein
MNVRASSQIGGRLCQDGKKGELSATPHEDRPFPAILMGKWQQV